MLKTTNSTVQSWSELEGKVLNGQYLLVRCLSDEESFAVFSTEIAGEEPRPAVIKMTAATEAGQQQREVIRLQRAQSLSHPNLIQLLGFGTGEVEGLPISYAVLEPSDDNLAKVLVDRPLEQAELMELLNALVEPLEYLHGEGLVHTGLIPSNIFSVGETIKIAGDCVQEPRSPRARASKSPYTPPEFDTAGWTPAGDIWTLGVTMFYSLTQRYPVSASTIQNANLPLKIAALLSRCLQLEPEQRPTAAQIVAWSKKGEPFPTARSGVTPGLPAAREVPKPAAPAPVAKPAQLPLGPPLNGSMKSEPLAPAPAPAAPIPATPILATPTPVAYVADEDLDSLNDFDVEPAATHRIREELPRIDRLSALERYEAAPRRPAWIYAVLAVVVIIGIIWVLRASSRASKPVGPTAMSSSAPSTSAPVTPKADSASKPAPLLHSNAKAAPKKPTNAAAASRPVTDAKSAAPATKLERASVWRVVVFTYNRQSDAEHKAHALNEKRNGPKAEVFTPNKGRAPYLVALGGWMNRDDAARVRRAAAKGLPHDAYVQNFKR